MASGIMKKRSPEEIIKSQGGESYKGKAGQDVKITGGVSGSGLYSPQSNGLNLRDYRIDDRGRLVVNPGVEEYVWNERLKRYDAAPGMGRGYLLAEQVNAPAEEGSGGGGGGSQAAEVKMRTPGTDGNVYYGDPGQGVTTAQVMGNTYNQMQDWRPISRGMNGGTQSMNPLVDPNAWLYQIEPQYTVPKPVGTYIENDLLLNNNKGLLV